jgi:hypothetical protein
MNNLYSHAMNQLLSEKDFQWLSENEVKNFDPLKINPSGTKGYFVECDLDYSDISIHDHHNDSPLAPEKISIDKSNFGSYQKT